MEYTQGGRDNLRKIFTGDGHKLVGLEGSNAAGGQ